MNVQNQRNKTEMTKQTSSKRLLSLDILRGITIAGMILVNNPGSWSNAYAPLRHAEWNGLTPTDLVFPFFMFIMGISTYISLRKYSFKPSKDAIIKILRRFVVIFAIGLAMGWFSRLCYGTVSRVTGEEHMPFLAAVIDSANNFESMRILGVLPRLAISYCVASLIAIYVNHKHLLWIISCILISYALMLLFGNGYEFSEENIINIVDRAVLGVKHMYTDVVGGVRLTFDPEGFLSTLPSIAHVLLGVYAGEKIMNTTSNDKKIQFLFITGAILTFSGFLLSYGFPINKKIWSPTFVLTTCGLASTLLALLIWIIDIKGYNKWCTFFQVFGVNPLYLFVQSGVLATLFGAIRWANSDGGYTTIHGFLYNDLMKSMVGDPYFASLLYSILFILINWIVGYYLFKKKIYIKI